MALFRIRRYDAVPSTNVLVKDAIAAGEAQGLVCRAREQTGGYGRQGRTWSSPVGGLYQSVLLRPDVPAVQLPSIGLVVALSIRSTLLRLGHFADGDIQVKWPNDIVSSTGKLAGISSEAHAGGVCVGMGVNVLRLGSDDAIAGKYVAAYFAEMLADGASSAAAFAQPRFGFPDSTAAGRAPADVVGDEILCDFEPRYRTWCEKGFAAFHGEYRLASYLTGRAVRMAALDGSVLAEGVAVDVDAAGNLLLAGDDGTIVVSSGEAHIL